MQIFYAAFAAFSGFQDAHNVLDTSRAVTVTFSKFSQLSSLSVICDLVFT